MKPMLAATPTSLSALRFPCLASPKLDGIRCLMIDGRPKSRKLLDIPNRHIQLKLKGLPPLDGELIVKGSFQDVTSAVMSEDGTPDFEYHVFDRFDDWRDPFWARHAAVKEYVIRFSPPHVKVVPHTTIETAEDLIEYEEKTVKAGYEGIMLRKPDGPYKFGRSTEREGWLLKIKRFTQDEAVVIGVEEQVSNQNAAQTDNLGHTKRSSSKAGFVRTGVLGSLTVRSLNDSLAIEFSIGTGFDAAQRAQLWKQRKSLIGKIVTYKYQEKGAKDAPRFPVFLGFRDPRDMG